MIATPNWMLEGGTFCPFGLPTHFGSALKTSASPVMREAQGA
jgi:hypothetical protein